MKRYLLILFLLSPILSLFALRCGDDVVELNGIRWLRGTPQQMTVKHNKEGRREYRVAVFMLTNAGNAPETLRILDQMARRYSQMLQLCVITPDPRSEAENLLSRVHTTSLSFGVDPDRKLTQRYMAGSMLYPMAFVAGQMRTIEWNGEAIDLPEFLAETEKNPVDTDKYEKISPLLDELQTLMRSNDNRKMRITAARVFKADPGNAAALRMRLFYLENTGRIREAWETLRQQLSSVPDKARLYYTALDMIARYPLFSGSLPTVTDDFSKHISDPDACDYMVWQLLKNFDFDPAALGAAVKLYEKSAAESKKIRRAPAALAGHYSTGALLAARLGNLAKAIELQRQTVRCWKNANNPSAALAAEKTMKYFDLCNKTRVKW